MTIGRLDDDAHRHCYHDRHRYRHPHFRVAAQLIADVTVMTMVSRPVLIEWSAVSPAEAAR
jgi:hypothetical protein